MSDLFISREQAESDMLACAAYLGERIKSSDGHAEVMNAVVPRYLDRGEVDLAAELSNALDDPFARDRLLTMVAAKCAEQDDDEYALQLADAIEDHGLQQQALERVALVMASRGDFDAAVEIAAKMMAPDFVYAGIAVKQSAEGHEEASIAMLSTIIFPTARVSGSLQIAHDRIEKEDTNAAFKALDEAKHAANDIEHDEEKIRAFCDIANLYFDAKRNDKAIETYDVAKGLSEKLDNSHRDFFLVNCALGFLYSGSTELADRVLDLVTDKTQMASALLAMARESWKNEDKDAALETLDESYAIVHSQTESETRDSRSRNQLIGSLAAQFAGFGKTDRGVEVALENPDPSEQTAALSQIARILTFQKEDEIARQTINLIAEDADRLFSLVAVSDEKEKMGEREGALTLLDEAVTLAESVPQLPSRSEVLNEIAVRFSEYGHIEKAQTTVGENLAVIAQIRDESSRAASLAVMSDLFGDEGMTLTTSEAEHLEKLAKMVE